MNKLSEYEKMKIVNMIENCKKRICSANDVEEVFSLLRLINDYMLKLAYNRTFELEHR